MYLRYVLKMRKLKTGREMYENWKRKIKEQKRKERKFAKKIEKRGEKR